MATGISWQRLHSGKSKQNVFSAISWQHVSASIWPSAVHLASCGTQMSSFSPLHPTPSTEWLPLALPEAGLSPSIRMHCRLAKTWVGSNGSGSREQLTLKWRFAWSVQSKTQFLILGKIKWLFSVHTAETKYTFPDSSFSFHSREKVWKSGILFSLEIKRNI